MPGGTMNLVSGGAGDLLLTGSPTQSFFKTTYNKYTPFGVQLFRLDYEGSRALSENRHTTMTFKVARYGDLLYDSYLVITMPAIYSDYRCSRCASYNAMGDDTIDDKSPCCCDSIVPGDWAQRQDYQFGWVPELGYTFIDEITVSIGGSVISRMSGDWMGILKTLGRTGMDSILIDQMIGNTPDMIAPSSTNSGVYPTVPKLESRPAGHYPSIAGRTLYIPLGSWFTNTPSQALPLVSLQYQDVEVMVRLRPLSHLYTIAVFPGPDGTGEKNEQAPTVDCTLGQTDCGDNLTVYTGDQCAETSPTPTPPSTPTCPGCPDKYTKCQKDLPTVPRSTAGDPCLFAAGSEINRSTYPSCRIQEWLSPTCSGEDITLQHFLEGETISLWNPDIHILARYVFLGDDERRVFAKIEQKYLINTATYIDFESVDPTGKAALDISGIVSTYVWRFQRSDVALRNQWMNYTNYAYMMIPNIPYQRPYMYCGEDLTPPQPNPPKCPRFPKAQESSGRDWNFYGVPPERQLYTPSNERDIMVSASLLLNGEVRESFFPAQVWNYVTKFTTQSDGDLELGVYYYGYGLNDEIGDTQPSGALAMGKYTGATLQFTTLVPPLKDDVIVPAGTFVPGPNPLYEPCNGSTVCPTTDAQRDAEIAADNAIAAEVCESWARASGAALGQGTLARRSIYTYNLRVYIERYNVLVINSGMGGLQYAT